MERLPDGVRLEDTAGGFCLRLRCRSFADTLMRVGLSGVVSSLPFVLWWDLIRNFWSDEGFSFWATAVFLSVWQVAIAYTNIVALVSLFGEVRVTKAGDRGEIFTGIGKAGWTHRLRWSDFDRAVLTETGSSGHRVRYVVLEGRSKRYRFGWQLPGERQEALVAVLNQRGLARPS